MGAAGLNSDDKHYTYLFRLDSAAGYIDTSAECALKLYYGTSKPFIHIMVRIDSDGNMIYFAYEIDNDKYNIWIEIVMPTNPAANPCGYTDYLSNYFKVSNKGFKLM